MIGTIQTVNIYDVAIFFNFTKELFGILDHNHLEITSTYLCGATCFNQTIPIWGITLDCWTMQELVFRCVKKAVFKSRAQVQI